MVIAILLVTLILDQATKLWAQSSTQVVINQGVSFGLLGHLSPELLTGLLIMCTAIVIKLAWTYRSTSPVMVGLFIGGAVSNIVDRVLIGGVRDWIPIPGTTIVNNLADYAIGVAVVLLVYHWIRHAYGQY